MRIKVELHPDVVWFIRHRCTADEADAFYERLEAIRTAPIGKSDHITVAGLRAHELRFFRFGTIIAVFEYDPARNRIRVLQCRKQRPLRRPRPPDEDEP